MRRLEATLEQERDLMSIANAAVAANGRHIARLKAELKAARERIAAYERGMDTDWLKDDIPEPEE